MCFKWRTVRHLCKHQAMEPVTEAQSQAWRDAIAAQLKAERALRSLDQEAVCKRAGISRSTYSRIERGGGTTLDHLVAIAAAFEMPLPELMGRAQTEMERRAANLSAPQGSRKKGVIARTAKREATSSGSEMTESSRL